MTITALLDRVFFAIASTNNQPMPYVTTKTVAYIFALVIDCVTVFHQVSPHSRALQHEASILKELDSMPPDDFWTELRGSLTNFYENIACGGGSRSTPPRSGGATDASPGAACRQRRWQAQDFLIETCLSLHYCD